MPEEKHSEAAAAVQSAAASPYVTGGGGFTLERRIASIYLAHMLRGSRADELRGRSVVSVHFQAPGELIDDIIIHAAREGEDVESLTLYVAARRAPKFVTSDEQTMKLLKKFIQAIALPDEEGMEREFAIAVAGVQTAPSQVADLASFARNRPQTEFFKLIASNGVVAQELRDRLGHLKGLVKRALGAPEVVVQDTIADETTWKLLSRLSILSHRVETPSQNDWADLANTLSTWSRAGSLSGGQALRDRLEILAGEYAAKAGVVNSTMLRRDLHDHLTQSAEKRHPGWAALLDAQDEARALIRSQMGADSTGKGLHLPRTDLAGKLRDYLGRGQDVLVHGPSGCGKSALVIGALTAELEERHNGFEYVYVDLRRLPATAMELRLALGAGLEVLLSDVSAPVRYIVVDNAGSPREGGDSLLPWVIKAARSAGLNFVAVTTSETLGSVRTVLDQAFKKTEELEVPLLDDSELNRVGQHFPKLLGLVSNTRSRDILRRPMVAHLLAQSGTEATSLSEVEALNEVWERIVLGNSDLSRGTPRAREEVLLKLAYLSLAPQSGVQQSLDPTALYGLERDGLLHRATGLPWDPAGQATFFHDQIRLFAISKILMQSQHPADLLLQNGAARWTLPAARIAAQAILSAGASPALPVKGRLNAAQIQFQALADAGHGERWADVPVEAALPLGGARDVFGEDWDGLLADEARGLRRVLRILEQRHTHGIQVDPLVAEPIVDLLLERGWPPVVDKDVKTLVRRWLGALVLNGSPAGQALRLRVRAQLEAKIEQEDHELQAQIKARHASRDRKANLAADLGFFTPAQQRRHTSRAQLPTTLRDDHSIEVLALLGADLGTAGKALLLRVAENSPSDLRAALEEVPAARGIAQFDPALLTRLTAAYYIDSDIDPDDQDEGWGFRDEGIRGHRSRGHWGAPFNAFWMGSFLVMLQHDFVGGVGVINRMLDHAAKCRVRTLHQSGLHAEDGASDGLPLVLTKSERNYIGDDHVWSWYRGSSVGPYPCMSALAALEWVCDGLVKQSGKSLEYLVPFLLRDSNNLAMPALVLGMLVRHLEDAGELVDPFLAEPELWDLELSRTVNERLGYPSQTEGIAAPERRLWGLREAASHLAVHADDGTETRLNAVADRLIERAKHRRGFADSMQAGSTKPQWLALVEKNAGLLRKGQYRLVKYDDGYYLEQEISADVEESLRATNLGLDRGYQTVGMTLRHIHSVYQPESAKTEMTLQVLTEDIAAAQDLLHDPPPTAVGLIDACTGVAASALNYHFLGKLELPAEQLLWAAQVILEAVELYDNEQNDTYEYGYFYQGADRSAARSVALLTLPQAADLRDALAAAGLGQDEILKANRWAATRSSRECRLFYGRSLDIVWASDGSESYWGPMLSLVEDSARDCVIGEFVEDRQTTERILLAGPLEVALAGVPAERVIVQNLIPAIRGLAGATRLPGNEGVRGRRLLTTLVETYGTARLQEKYADLHSGADMLNVVRALLPLIRAGEDGLLWQQLDNFFSQSDLLAEFLRALAAAGEETTEAAATVESIWPAVMGHVLDLIGQGKLPAGNGLFPYSGVASLIPNMSYQGQYMYRETAGEAIVWWDAQSLQAEIERWLRVACGKAECVDRLIALISLLDEKDQVKPGLEWVEAIVLPDASEVAGRSYLLPEWLAKVRRYGLLSTQPICRSAWQGIVDALLVSGETRIAELDD